MDAVDLLVLLGIAVYLLPAIVVLAWPMAEPWHRGPDGILWREENRRHPWYGQERWLVVWTPGLGSIERAAYWALDRMDERSDIVLAEQQWEEPDA